MKIIQLTQGKVAMVDDEDFDQISVYKWYAERGYNTFYAARHKHIRPWKKVFMHREIIELLPNQKIDHKNHNGLDNRKCNLRICFDADNSHNQRLNRNNTSGYKGVCWHIKGRKWMSYIGYNNHSIYLGLFDDKMDAAITYDQKAKELFGKFAYLNFNNENNLRVKCQK